MFYVSCFLSFVLDCLDGVGWFVCTFGFILIYLLNFHQSHARVLSFV
jgi:hypothetical protein